MTSLLCWTFVVCSGHRFVQESHRHELRQARDRETSWVPLDCTETPLSEYNKGSLTFG